MNRRPIPPEATEREDGARIQFRSEAEAAGFTILPNPVLRSDHLTPVAKTLYALLRSYAWDKEMAWPGRATLAAQVPCSDNTLTKGLRDLQDHHLITIQRRGQGQTNIYWLETLDDTTLEALK